MTRQRTSTTAHELRVVKFGGTSVANGLPEVVRRIQDSRRRGPTVVVVSAFAGLTDQLTRLADDTATSRQDVKAGERPDVDALVHDLARRCGDAGSPHLQDLRRLAERATREGRLSGAARHALLAVGERLAAEAVVRTLRSAGVSAQTVDGTEVLVACGRSGRVDFETSRRRTRHRLGATAEAFSESVPVVTGFIAAADGSGHAVTLGRGASDLSATLLAAFLDAKEVEIWTDTDGIWSADPNRLNSAQPIRSLSYGEASSMARWGAKVLHPETLEPVAAVGIPVQVRSTFEPDAPGSRVEERSETERKERPVRAIARLPSVPGDQLVWIAAIGADAERFGPELPTDTVASRLVERAEGDHPRVEAVLVERRVADEVERAFHRELVERWEVDELRLTA